MTGSGKRHRPSRALTSATSPFPGRYGSGEYLSSKSRRAPVAGWQATASAPSLVWAASHAAGTSTGSIGRDPVAALNTRLWKRAGRNGPLRRVAEAPYALAAPA